MKPVTLSPDDPRLTAFALGELSGDERAQIAAIVQDDPALQAAVAEIRALAGDLTDALATEPVTVPSLSTDGASSRSSLAREVASRRVVRFPYFLISGLAAAGFAVLVAVHDTNSPVRPKVETVQNPQPLELTFPSALDGSVASDDHGFALPASAAVAASSVPTDSAPGAEAAEPPVRLPVSDTFSRPLLEQVRVAQESPIPAAPLRQFEGSAMVGALTPDHAQALAVATTEVARRQAERSASLAGERQARFFGGASPGIAGGEGGRMSSMTTFAPGMPAPVAEAAPSEAYAYNPEQGFVRVGDQPVSTFSVDVDTASYANVRRFLQNNRLPPVDAVRIEELINYFPYRYAPPAPDSSMPIAADIEAAAAPWNPAHRLVRIGLKGREFAAGERPAANLVFLIDVSGSMNAPNRLPLVRESMRMLVEQLRPDDRVAIVTYAGQSGLALPSTPVARRREIFEALDALRPGGSTHGSLGIQLAYDIARTNYVSAGLNRVILCTDGDFNVGLTSEGELVRLAEEKARSGVFLTALGFGMGNLKDATLEAIAQRGNGNYGYVDSVREARKLLIEQVEGTLATIAKDVKVQVEFNPAKVASYRLVGYENRALKREDFDNDTVDAGDIGAGHSVTALYEVVPVPATGGSVAPVEPLRYQPPPLTVPKLDPAILAEFLTVKVRYKEPAGTESRQVDLPFVDRGSLFEAASGDFKFAAAVAGFGQILRASPYKGEVTFDRVLTWADPGLRDDPGGHRAEFVELVRMARDLTGR